MKTAGSWLDRVRHRLLAAVMMACAAVAAARSAAGTPPCDPPTDPYCLGFTPEPAAPTWRLAWITEEGRAILEVPLAEWVPFHDPHRPELRGGSAPGFAIPPAADPVMAFSPLTLRMHPYVRAARRVEGGDPPVEIVNPQGWRIVPVNGEETRQSFCSLGALFDYTSIGAPVLGCLRVRDEHGLFDLADGVWEETRMAFAFAGPRRHPMEFSRPGSRSKVCLPKSEADSPPALDDASLARAVEAHLASRGFAAALPEPARGITGWRLSGFTLQDIPLRVAGAAGRQPFLILSAGYVFDSPRLDGGASQWLLLRPAGDGYVVVGVWPLDFDGPDRSMTPRDFLLAVDLDDDGTDELVTSSAAWETWTFEVYQWTGSAIRRLYASPARGI